MQGSIEIHKIRKDKFSKKRMRELEDNMNRGLAKKMKRRKEHNFKMAQKMRGLYGRED